MTKCEFEISTKVANIERVSDALVKVLRLQAWQFSMRSDIGVAEPDAIYGYHPDNTTLQLAHKDPRKGKPDFKLEKPAETRKSSNGHPVIMVVVDTDKATIAVDELREQVFRNLKPWWSRLGGKLF